MTEAEQKTLVEHMLSEVEMHLDEKGIENEFIVSLRSQVDAKWALTPKQVEGLRKFYERI